MSSNCKKVDCNEYNDNNNDRNETTEEVISRHRKRLEVQANMIDRYFSRNKFVN